TTPTKTPSRECIGWWGVVFFFPKEKKVKKRRAVPKKKKTTPPPATRPQSGKLKMNPTPIHGKIPRHQD
ncbi:hypothetical protein, partial [Marinobacter shengliensis]